MDNNLLNRPLSRGKHQMPEDGMCVQEYLRLYKGAEFSDAALPCQSPELRELLVRFNDEMPDTHLQQLKFLGLRTLGTADDGEALFRAFKLADWAIRIITPMAFEAANILDQAPTLRKLDPVVDARAAARAARAARAATVWDEAIRFLDELLPTVR